MKEGPGSSLILGQAKGSLVVRQRGVAFLLASVGRIVARKRALYSVRESPLVRITSTAWWRLPACKCAMTRLM